MECIIIRIYFYIIINTNCLTQIVKVTNLDLERAAEQECSASGKLYQPRPRGRDRLEL